MGAGAGAKKRFNLNRQKDGCQDVRIGRLDQSQEGEGERERELSMKNFALPLKFKDESDSCCERNRKRWTLPPTLSPKPELPQL